MIKLEITRDAQGGLTAFTVRNHGASHVCAAVSLLVLNTVNAVEALTNAKFSCDHAPEGGFIAFALQSARDTAPGREAGLLLDAMLLGLTSVKEQYPQDFDY